MLWLYLLSIAVLIGAAVNAAFDRIWPEKETARARMEIVRRLRMKALMPRLRRDDGGAGAVPRRGRRDRAAQRYDEEVDAVPEVADPPGRRRRGR